MGAGVGGMRSGASLRLRQLKADRGPAAITHDEPHPRATEKRQLIFAVGQSVPHPAAGVRHQGECIHDSSRAQLHLRSASGGRRALRPAVLASAGQWSAYGQGSAPSPDGLRGSEGCP